MNRRPVITLPAHLTSGFPATAAVLTISGPRTGAGNCRRCGGTGEGPGFGVLFCAQCGGTGDCGNAPQRVAVPGGHVTINGPVPEWLAALLRDPSAVAPPVVVPFPPFLLSRPSSRMDKIAEWFLAVTSYNGISIGAEHYYGRIIPADGSGIDRHREDLKLVYTPTREQAERLVDKQNHGNEPSAGYRERQIAMEIRTGSGKFWTLDELYAVARLKFITLAGRGPAILSDGDGCVYEARELVGFVGLPDATARRLRILGKLVRRTWREKAVNKCGFYDLKPRDRKRVDAATSEYYKILSGDV